MLLSSGSEGDRPNTSPRQGTDNVRGPIPIAKEAADEQHILSMVAEKRRLRTKSFRPDTMRNGVDWRREPADTQLAGLRLGYCNDRITSLQSRASTSVRPESTDRLMGRRDDDCIRELAAQDLREELTAAVAVDHVEDYWRAYDINLCFCEPGDLPLLQCLATKPA